MSTKALQILVVEVHDAIRESVVAAMRAIGHSARGQANVHAAMEEISSHPTDIVILATSGDESIELLKAIRSSFPAVGILVISPLNRSSDKADGYSNGADIYLVKPVSDEEIGAAVTSIARRVRPIPLAASLAEVPLDSPYVLHKPTLQLIGPNAFAHVSDMEQQILIAFAQASDHRIELAQMLQLNSKKGIEPSKATMEVQIVRLRKKLESIGAPAHSIKSIRGTGGYQLCVPLLVKSQFATL